MSMISTKRCRPCFEWDVKRLAVSLAVAGRVAGASDREARQLARTATKNYRRHMGRLALMSPLEAWSSRIDLAGAIADIDTPKIQRPIEKRRAAVLRGAAEHYGLVERKNGDWKVREKIRGAANCCHAAVVAVRHCGRRL